MCNLHLIKLEQIDTFLDLCGWRKVEENLWFPPQDVSKFLDKMARDVILDKGGLKRSLAMYTQVEYEEKSLKSNDRGKI